MTIMKTSLSGHRKIIDNATRWHFRPLIHAWTRGGAPGGDSLGARAGVRPLAGPGAAVAPQTVRTSTAALGLCTRMSLPPGRADGARGAGGVRGHAYHVTSSGSENTNVLTCVMQIRAPARVGNYVRVRTDTDSTDSSPTRGRPAHACPHTERVTATRLNCWHAQASRGRGVPTLFWRPFDEFETRLKTSRESPSGGFFKSGRQVGTQADFP